MTDTFPNTIFKALSDPSRIRIIEILSEGEMCACKLLEKMEFTQPTLSHHMGILVDAELVTPKKEGKWVHYSLNGDTLESAKEFFAALAAKVQRSPVSQLRISGYPYIT